MQNITIGGVEYEPCAFGESDGVYHVREGRVLSHDEYRRDFAGDCILPVRRVDDEAAEEAGEAWEEYFAQVEAARRSASWRDAMNILRNLHDEAMREVEDYKEQLHAVQEHAPALEDEAQAMYDTAWSYAGGIFDAMKAIERAFAA